VPGDCGDDAARRRPRSSVGRRRIERRDPLRELADGDVRYDILPVPNGTEQLCAASFFLTLPILSPIG
jgi:hypothetical protein